MAFGLETKWNSCALHFLKIHILTCSAHRRLRVAGVDRLPSSGVRKEATSHVPSSLKPRYSKLQKHRRVRNERE